MNLLKHVLFSCTSKVDAFNPAGKHIASQLQLNVSQSKMIFNSNRSFGAEPIKPFCWFHITKWFSIVSENLPKLFYLNRLSSETPKSKFLGLRRAGNSMWFKRVCVQLWISPPKHFLCSGDRRKAGGWAWLPWFWGPVWYQICTFPTICLMDRRKISCRGKGEGNCIPA